MKKLTQEIPAFLWDGERRIVGKVIIENDRLVFEMCDFQNTNLDFSIYLKDVFKTKYIRPFGINSNGLEMIMNGGSRNVFVFDNETHIKNLLDLINKSHCNRIINSMSKKK